MDGWYRKFVHVQYMKANVTDSSEPVSSQSSYCLFSHYCGYLSIKHDLSYSDKKQNNRKHTKIWFYQWSLDLSQRQWAVANIHFCTWYTKEPNYQIQPPYLFLSVKPAVHHWMVGTEWWSCGLPLELSGPATRIPRQAPVSVTSPALHRTSKRRKCGVMVRLQCGSSQLDQIVPRLLHWKE